MVTPPNSRVEIPAQAPSHLKQNVPHRHDGAKYAEDLLSAMKGRIAIVGNATPKHDFGKIIDGYDTVIRLNNFRVAGFEKLVGSKVDYRCTSAWDDIEHRDGLIEFSPFTASATESANLEIFNRANARQVLPACTDIHPFITETPKPSTGFALIQLCACLGVPVDLFAFDGFKTAHYWDKNEGNYTTHSRGEIDFILKRPGVLLYSETYPGCGVGHWVIEGGRKSNSAAPVKIAAGDNTEFYVNLFIKNPIWSTPHPNEDEAARWEKISGFLKNIADGQTAGNRLRILDVGCGRGWLTHLASAFGECEGVEPVAAVAEQARKLFPERRFTAGTADTILARADFQPYDLILTSEVIEHVPQNDQEAFAQKLFRLLKPGGHVILTTPRGEALQEWTRLAGDPSQPVEDWICEPQLRELFVKSKFNVTGHERVLFDTASRRYVTSPNANQGEPLLPIYQVWAFQKPVALAPPKDGQGELTPDLSPNPAKAQGYSFCIITNGKYPEKLAEEIASIRALQIPSYEILVGGDVPAGLDGVQTLSLPGAAQAGRLGEMRNRLMEIARYDHLVMSDDDMLFHSDFYEGLRRFGEDYEVLCVRLLNKDGTRFWDWATIGGPRGHRLIDYDETDAHVYVTGGFCVMKTCVGTRIKWDGQRGFYQGEDVDFSRRLHEAGISIQFNRYSTVTHSDGRYTQMGTVVMTTETLRRSALDKVDEGKTDDARALFERLRAHDPATAAVVMKEAPVLEKTLLRLPVRWRGPIFNPSGYASEGINFVLPLARRVELGIFHQNNNYSEKFVAGLKAEERNRLFLLRDRYSKISGGIVIEHNPANGFTCVPDAAYRIGRTMFETDRISPDWVTACNQMDEIWVPSAFNVETYAGSGVERDKLRIMPGSVDETEFDPAKHEPLPLPNRAGCNFLSIFEWSRRKGWDVLLAAYLREFSADDDVCLYVRTYLFSKPSGDPRPAIERLIGDYAASLNLGDKRWPRIHILSEQVAQADLPRLYKAADCLVAPSRGEGWGRPHHEAMLMGLPVIATNWSGNTEFMHPENSFLIDYKIVDTTSLDPELWHYRNHRWAEPSESGLRQAMRRVQQDPGEARGRGRRARQDMVRLYSRGVVAGQMLARLQEIERQLFTPACPAVTARALEIPASPAGQKAPRLCVTWEGSFLDSGSLSHVNRELTGALAANNQLQLTRVTQKNQSVPSEFKNLARRIQSDAPGHGDVTVRHAWPPNWQRPAAGAWVLIQPWEFGVLPAIWIKNLSQVDEIWTPSDYVRRVYVESGIHPSKVKIVPNGIDPAQFRPDLTPLPLATNKRFKFLFVGGTIQRKGPDVLLKSYLESFNASDDVCLVIKDFGGQSVYQGQTLDKEIAAIRLNPNAPEIVHLTEELPAESMPRLYAACQCLVHPYRGEGFGLPVLEAMACGLPVIVTGGGATDDFAPDEFACRLPALRQSIGDQVGGLQLRRNGWWLEPDSSALTARLRWIMTHPDEARTLGRAASDYVRREWTWERAARIASHRLQDLAARKKTEAAALAARRARKTASVILPPAAKVGDLVSARELLARKCLSEAWQTTVAAIAVRPCHPDGYLLLAEIAKAAGDGPIARRCAHRAKSLAPDWKAPKQFLKASGNLPLPARRDPTLAQAMHSFVIDPQRAPRLSVCLIVKNEEAFLARCLDSVRDVASQIVIVDTGSTDRTVDIAKEHGAEVHHFAWCDDFSAARNAVLEHATGDWLLWLDADEELLSEHKKTLQREMQEASVLSYRLPIVDKGREEEGCSYVPRLFRNAPGLFFLGRIHEQASSSIQVRCKQWGLKNILGKTVLLHYGYTDEMVSSRNKIERNLHLLELAIEELPGEPSLVMNLGLEMIRSGRLEAGLEQYCEAVRLMSALPADQVVPELRETLLTQFTTHLLGAKLFSEIVQLWGQPFLRSFELTASQHFMLGLAHMQLKQNAAAMGHMRQCLAKRGRPVLAPIYKEILKAGPRHCLALCLAGLEQNAEAEKAFDQALGEDPKSCLVRYDFANFQFQQGRPLQALKLANELVAENRRNLQAWLLGGRISLSQPEFLEFAQNWTGEAAKQAPEVFPILLQRAEALLLNQDVESALPLWTRAHSPKNPRDLAALILCEVLAGQCHRHLAPPTEKLISQEYLKWYRHLIKFKALSVVSQINEKLDELQPILPSAVRVLGAAMKKAETAMAV